jgi:hypothetical protein
LLEIGEAWRSTNQQKSLIEGLRVARAILADPSLSGGTLAGALAALRGAK